jgi:hypothetical protein
MGLVAVVVLLALAACSPADSSPTPTPAPSYDSGIVGIVLLGPTCAQSDYATASPCLTPYAAQLVIVDGNGDKVASVASGPDGHFQITLPPGDYVVQPTPGPDGNPSGTPVPVTVVDGQYEQVEIDYDTGLR